MGNYNDRGNSGGWGDKKSNYGGGGNRGRDDNYGGRPTMHDATCAKCNMRCEVPFKPNGRKPIYCSECFEKNDDRGSSYDRPRDNDRSDSYERPRSSSKPSFQSTPASDSKEVVKQLKTIGIKMDKIIQLLMDFSE